MRNKFSLNAIASSDSISTDEFTWEVILPGITNRAALASIVASLLNVVASNPRKGCKQVEEPGVTIRELSYTIAKKH